MNYVPVTTVEGCDTHLSVDPRLGEEIVQDGSQITVRLTRREKFFHGLFGLKEHNCHGNRVVLLLGRLRRGQWSRV